MKRFLFLLVLISSMCYAGNVVPVLKIAVNPPSQFPLTPPLTVSPSSAEIATPGYSFSLTATSPSSGAISYSSSDTDIATVSAAGLVTIGVTTGSTDITVSQAAVGSYFAAAQTVVPVVASWDVYLPWNAYDVAVYFDGSDDVAIGSAYGLPATASARTIMFWIYDQEITDAKLSVTLFYGGGGGISKSVFLGYWSTTAALFSTWASSYNFTTTRASEWRHHAYVMPLSGTIASMTFWENGVENATKTVAEGTARDVYNTETSTGMYLGNIPGRPWPWKGKLAEIAIFNKALTSEEINSYRLKRLTGLEPNLVRLYHCDEGSGTTLVDACGTGYNLTLTGGATWTTKL